jgi:hypothetical protein
VYSLLPVFLFAAAILIGGHAAAQTGVISAPPTPQSDADQLLPMVQDHIGRMQQQMDRLHQTRDPKEREKLVKEHLQTMRDTIRAMHGTSGEAQRADPQQWRDAIDLRMEVIQVMMDQIIQHQQLLHEQIMPLAPPKR